jgi:prepilin-type N-terminal cleavage/methylation domain-containing protein
LEMKAPLQSRSSGFTLIELLLVIGIITVLTAGIGVALQGGDRSVALRSAQGILVSLLNAARGQASLAGRNAALLVQADPSADNYLHSVVVALRDPGDTKWIPIDDWLQLPAGVYLLPVTTPTGALAAPGVDWGGLRSSAFAPATEAVNSVPCLVFSFTSRGTVSGGGNIVLATAARVPIGGAAPIQFVQPDAVRGVVVSSYGVATLVDDRTGFQ